MDSSYRRIRGETALSIDEVYNLCRHFKISFDAFTSPSKGLVTFNYTDLSNNPGNFEIYLQSILTDLQLILAAETKQIIYAGQDIPVFYHYGYPEIAAFKMFYWMKSIMNASGFEDKKFELANISDELFETGKKIIDLYRKIPSIEIWTNSTIESTLKQITFYWDSGIFHSATDAIKVCEALKLELTEIQKQAERSTKVLDSIQDSKSSQPNYILYFSEIELTNNCVLIQIGDSYLVYLGHFSFNTMSSSNNNYADQTSQWLNNIIKKSVQVSGISEKQRYQFFKKMFQKLDQLINKIRTENEELT